MIWALDFLDGEDMLPRFSLPVIGLMSWMIASYLLAPRHILGILLASPTALQPAKLLHLIGVLT